MPNMLVRIADKAEEILLFRVLHRIAVRIMTGRRRAVGQTVGLETAARHLNQRAMSPSAKL